MVDPLDGTKEFIKESGEYTVNIALIENNTPILGVIYANALSVLYYGSKNNGSLNKRTDSSLIQNTDFILFSMRKDPDCLEHLDSSINVNIADIRFNYQKFEREKSNGLMNFMKALLNLMQ